jgi:hypothetical protein
MAVVNCNNDSFHTMTKRGWLTGTHDEILTLIELLPPPQKRICRSQALMIATRDRSFATLAAVLLRDVLPQQVGCGSGELMAPFALLSRRQRVEPPTGSAAFAVMPVRAVDWTRVIIDSLSTQVANARR